MKRKSEGIAEAISPRREQPRRKSTRTSAGNEAANVYREATISPPPPRAHNRKPKGSGAVAKISAVKTKASKAAAAGVIKREPDGITRQSDQDSDTQPLTARKRKREPKDSTKDKNADVKIKAETPKKGPKASTGKDKKSQDDPAGKENDQETETKPKKKRKTKEEKEAEKEPLEERTSGSKLFVGPHVSAAGGVHNAVTNCVKIGANAFALFLKSQRKWANPPLDPEVATSFKNGCAKHSYNTAHIVPHGSYLVNLAHTDPERAEQAYNGFIDDLERCSRTGITLYNIHPGNCASSTRGEAITHLAKQLNKANADPRSGKVVTLLETMAAAGNTIGGSFEDLRDVIAQVDDKSRIGICLDTCHVFAAGYDLRSPEAFKETFKKLDDLVGLKYLRALHVNDSKAPLDSRRDLHANLGTGFLGLRAFHNLANESVLWGLPFILETPIDAPSADKWKPGKMVEDEKIWAREVKMLESLVGMNVKGKEYVKLEKELWEQGTSERERVQAQVDKRAEKAAGKGKKKKKVETDESE